MITKPGSYIEEFVFKTNKKRPNKISKFRKIETYFLPFNIFFMMSNSFKFRHAPKYSIFNAYSNLIINDDACFDKLSLFRLSNFVHFLGNHAHFFHKLQKIVIMKFLSWDLKSRYALNWYYYESFLIQLFGPMSNKPTPICIWDFHKSHHIRSFMTTKYLILETKCLILETKFYN